MGRQNGKPILLLGPAWRDPEPPADQPDWTADSRYYVNLTEAECRTWSQALTGCSISSIARSERVSRQAIYARFVGKDGDGGMIAKNYWVLLWAIGRGMYPTHRKSTASILCEQVSASPGEDESL